ncbi:hypothetical protein SLEP1_g58514 [Rubroshorea leprosula]|uniref:Uncharacterized protein n=1 Tax=Rubroshorea leprosula TaxID=152421 RepID=A0AAV5MT60_9ROSI|nr:hypothetical protein SLEP1_g58514 [Rubroshorea leprosula]
MMVFSSAPARSPTPMTPPPGRSNHRLWSFAIPSPNESGKKIEIYSLAFYTACTFGGILSCGLIHMAITLLDLVKCSMQV